jgi:comEA protein
MRPWALERDSVPNLHRTHTVQLTRASLRIPRSESKEDTMKTFAATVALTLALAPFAAHDASAGQRGAKTESAASAEVINLNTATAAQIATLPGIGPKAADLVVEYRQKNGGFKKVEEIMNVRGIGEKTFLKLKNRITVAPAK